MSEVLIERIARALCERQIRCARWDTPTAEVEAKLDAAIDANWHEFRDDASSVLAAMALQPPAVANDVDLVARLRAGNLVGCGCGYLGDEPPSELQVEAADEIDRLRAEISRLTPDHRHTPRNYSDSVLGVD